MKKARCVGISYPAKTVSWLEKNKAFGVSKISQTAMDIVYGQDIENDKPPSFDTDLNLVASFIKNKVIDLIHLHGEKKVVDAGRPLLDELGVNKATEISAKDVKTFLLKLAERLNK